MESQRHERAGPSVPVLHFRERHTYPEAIDEHFFNVDGAKLIGERPEAWYNRSGLALQEYHKIVIAVIVDGEAPEDGINLFAQQAFSPRPPERETVAFRTEKFLVERAKSLAPRVQVHPHERLCALEKEVDTP